MSSRNLGLGHFNTPFIHSHDIVLHHRANPLTYIRRVIFPILDNTVESLHTFEHPFRTPLFDDSLSTRCGSRFCGDRSRRSSHSNLRGGSLQNLSLQNLSLPGSIARSYLHGSRFCHDLALVQRHCGKYKTREQGPIPVTFGKGQLCIWTGFSRPDSERAGSLISD